MRDRLTQSIPLLLAILVATAVAAIQYALLHHDPLGTVSRLSLTLLNLRQPSLRAGLSWRQKLEWAMLSTAEDITPAIGLGGFEVPLAIHIRQLRRSYETDACVESFTPR